MILSFHPLFEGDKHLLCAGRDPGPEELSAIQAATAVVLPQGCRRSLYDMARNHCKHVFPNYDARFKYPGKIGQTRLFQETGTPYPDTRIYEKTESFLEQGQIPKDGPFDYPFVFKFDWGGEGETVFCIDSEESLEETVRLAQTYEQSGQGGFLIQEFIPTRNRTLRVTVIGNLYTAYWRKAGADNPFYSNLSKGARIDRTDDPEALDAAVSSVRIFCQKTKINLAGIDILLSSHTRDIYFLEINYYFGRRGLGGSEKYYDMLIREIGQWIENEFTALPPPRSTV